MNEADSRPGGERLWPLVATVTGGVTLAAALWRMDGPPRIATSTLDWAHLREVLTASELADADVVAAASTIAWLALSYLALTIGLRILAVVARRLSGGARWAHAAMRLSNIVTLPSIRRVVDGGVAGTLLVSSWLPRTTRPAAVAPPEVVRLAPAPTQLAVSTPDPGPAWQSVMQTERQDERRTVEYTVVHGDYLWDIARRFYGDGSRFVEIVELNRGRVMPDGERFLDPRLVRPGWVLHIPLPARNLSAEADTATYRVQQGDHLWGIAERLLDDGFRWVEIWERNRDRELSSGRRFTDPDLIYPGWLLELPIATRAAAPPPAPTAGPDPGGPAPSPSAVASVQPSAMPERPAADATPVHDSDGGWTWEWPSLPRPVMVTAAGFAVMGGTAVFVQRLIQAGRLRPPGRGGTSRGQLGDAARVTLAMRAVAQALSDYGFEDSRPLLVRESGRRLEFTVQCPVGDADALVARRHDLERRLACDIETEIIGSSRVLLSLSGFQRLAGLLGEEAEVAAPALAVPVGSDDGGITYLNLASAGTTAVAGSERERRPLLRSWLATLSTTHAPQELAVRVDSTMTDLLGGPEALAHAGGAPPLEPSRVRSADGRARRTDRRQSRGRRRHSCARRSLPLA